MEQAKKAERFVSITDLWHLCAAQWKWFLVSVFASLTLAVYYLLTTPYSYMREAAIMVREQNTPNNVNERSTREFSEIDFFNQKGNLTNVVRHLSSLGIMMEVARQLDSLRNDTTANILDQAKGIQGRFKAQLEGINSTIINLSYKDRSTAEAECVLQLIIQVYNDELLKERYLATKNTSIFIDSRLRLLERDLDRVDDSIAVYKSRYGITDLEHVSDIYLQQQRQSDAELLSLTNQKAMAEYIRHILNDKSAQPQLLLVNSGINNGAIESQISLYNSLLLQLQSHMEYTSGQNPLIINEQKKLESLKKNILTNINNHIRTIDIQLNTLEGFHEETESKIESNPSQAKHLTSIEREQKVKESLYMYLLQKKEENEVSITHKTNIVQIIDIPNGSGKPVSPKRFRVLLAAMILGVLIPVIIIFLRATFDETVRDRFDIEGNSDIPFLGEVPFAGRRQCMPIRLLKRLLTGSSSVQSCVVVDYGRQDPSNEAFRIIRTNLEFVTNRNQGPGASRKGIVYLIKSTQIGAGKTYISMNMALTMAIANKRVLFIDCDLRDASASRQWNAPKKGLTDYLNGDINDFRPLLFHIKEYPTLEILPSGAMPNNPTELLNSPKFGQLINSVRSLYDIIIIDSPSAGMLADADIIGKHVDCKLFVVRAGYFHRRNLDELKSVHQDNVQQYVILNGVSIDSRYGFAYAHKYDRSERITNSWTNKIKRLLN